MKTINFRYCKIIYYNVLFIASLVIIFGIILLCLYCLKNIISAFIGLSILLVGIIFTFIISSMIAGKISDNKGIAIFDNDNVKLIFDEKTVRVFYNDIIKIVYKKIIGSNDGWSFLPKGTLIVQSNDNRICINGSVKEAWENKIEHGIGKSLKKISQSEVSLWNILTELKTRTQLSVVIEEIIEKDDGI